MLIPRVEIRLVRELVISVLLSVLLSRLCSSYIKNRAM